MIFKINHIYTHENNYDSISGFVKCILNDCNQTVKFSCIFVGFFVYLSRICIFAAFYFMNSFIMFFPHCFVFDCYFCLTSTRRWNIIAEHFCCCCCFFIVQSHLVSYCYFFEIWKNGVIKVVTASYHMVFHFIYCTQRTELAKRLTESKIVN